MAFSSSSLPETSPGGQEWSHMNKQLQQMTYGDAGLAFLPGGLPHNGSSQLFPAALGGF